MADYLTLRQLRSAVVRPVEQVTQRLPTMQVSDPDMIYYGAGEVIGGPEDGGFIYPLAFKTAVMDAYTGEPMVAVVVVALTTEALAGLVKAGQQLLDALDESEDEDGELEH